jgi:diguanylate cyclase (GGDEF)-like protein
MTIQIGKKQQQHGAWRIYMLQVSLVVALFVVGLYIGIYQRDRRLVQDQILISAQAYFKSIVLTRLWNAMYGGVFVEKKPGVKTNPHLINAEIKTVDGRTFTKRNPAMMTREISELAKTHSFFQYNITSLKPLNPENIPDKFERKALESFENGVAEAHIEEARNEKIFFRYMAPLETSQACLTCHAVQGYKVGDVRGGISVTFDITAMKNSLKNDRNIIIALTVGTTCIVICIVLFFTIRLMRQLQEAHRKIAELVVTDDLTGLANRRHFFERLDAEIDRATRYGNNLSLIMIDIDHFKRVNDTYGHPAGDIVLAEVARLLCANIRTSDLVARYGGEEFAVLIPALNAAEACLAAEKLRVIIEVNSIALEGPPLNVTVSCGVADLQSVKHYPASLKDNLIRGADKSLYQAKANGRNQVVTYKVNSEKQLPLV